jgi:hypothetical protein
MIRLQAYRQMDMDIRSYRKPQEAQMISTVVKCLQGIQMAKEPAIQSKNGSGNLAIRNRYFTRADDAWTAYDMCSNALWRQYY